MCQSNTLDTSPCQYLNSCIRNLQVANCTSHKPVIGTRSRKFDTNPKSNLSCNIEDLSCSRDALETCYIASYLLRHIFCPLCCVNTILDISLITLILRHTMTQFLISDRHLAIVVYLFLVSLNSLLRCITHTDINRFRS